MAVNYTPGQLRDAVGIGQETYRHWKKALAPLLGGSGHSPCFTPGDLLATVIVKILVTDYGMRVSALSAVASSLFRECNGRSWPALERSLLLLDIVVVRVLIQSEDRQIALDCPAMAVPLRAPIQSLRRALLAGGGDGQEMLRFPPVVQPTEPLQRRTSQS